MDHLIKKSEIIQNKESELRRNRTFIILNKGGEIEVSPNSEDKKIYTNGVNGCTVTAIYSECEDGSQKGILTHFESSFVKDNLDSIKKPERLLTKVQATVFVNYDEKDTYEPLNHVQNRMRSIDLIKKHLQDVFGPNISINVLPYKLTDNLDEDREISLVIKSKKDDTGYSAELNWWKGKINL